MRFVPFVNFNRYFEYSFFYRTVVNHAVVFVYVVFTLPKQMTLQLHSVFRYAQFVVSQKGGHCSAGSYFYLFSNSFSISLYKNVT